ncbi:MAG: PKD domain-containing protein [Cyclobacteriaceae bacterium]|nr:PKD domain-containing protein [Cyclobacteriaceae bacterium]
MRFISVLFSLLSVAFVQVFGQCPTPDFNMPASTCQQSLIAIDNLSSLADSYSWDFCSGDLANSPQAQLSFRLSASNGRPGIEFAKDENTWFGFVTGTFSNTLYRLEFANGTNGLPTSTENLGSLSGKLSSPGQVRIIKESNQWYGFIHNMTSGELLQLNFGNSLSNSFTVSTIFSGIGLGYGNSGFAMGKDPIDGWVCVISTGLNQFNIIRLGNLLATPGPSDIITSAAVPNPNNLGDVDLVNICGLWYGFADNLGNGNIYRLDFGFNLFSTPTIAQVTALTVGNPGRLRIAKEGEEYFVFVIALDGTLTKLEFGTDITSNPVIVSEGNVGNILQPNTYGLALVKENSEWTVLAISQSNGQVYNVKYPNICTATPMISNQLNPEVKYTQPGIYKVSLESTYALGASVKTKPITVSSVTAPDISFTSQNVCANNDVNFTSVNVSGDITDYNWDFDDTNASIAQDPIHQFTIAGDYKVKLQVTASNGCNNLALETITIYNEPVTNFDLPTSSPICTNQDYLFNNTSTFDPDSNPSWQWELNGIPTSINQDLTYTIPITTMQSIKLIASIPGCSSEMTKTINTVEDGPLVDFSFSNDCEDKSIVFTNETIGTVTGYAWDFGDGNNSTQTNPSNTFIDFGNYDVKLVASNLAGCMNTATKSIQIYSKPQPDFSLDLPPFSCNGSASQFNDLTPSPTDSNLDSWTWSFGDPSNGTSTTRNPQYVYADADQYEVNLDVTTNFGCTASIQKTITIYQSPNAEFTFNTACVNQSTLFIPLSTSGVDFWQWKIGTSTYYQQSPTHIFGSSSNYNAMLTATGSNGCVAVVDKLVNVPIPSNVNFSSINNCADQNTLFTDLTTGPDSVISRVWQFGTIGSASDATPTFTFPSSNTYPTRLTVTNESGCSYSISKDINIHEPPVVSFTATPQAGASPLTVQLKNTTRNSVSQQWLVVGANNLASTEVAPAFIFDELGDYTVDLTVEDESGCIATTSKIISVIIPVLDVELTSLSLIPTASGESNILLTIKNHSNLPVNNIKAIIDISGAQLINETIAATIQPNEVYSQILSTGMISSKNGGSYLCVELVVEGELDRENNKKCINNRAATVVMAPYPNPSSSELHLEWVSAIPRNAEISIFDPTGRKVFEHIFSDLEMGLNRATISLASFHPGVYYVFFASEGIRKSFPFVVRK